MLPHAGTGRAAWLAAALLATAAAAWQSRGLYLFYRTHERLPLWDMAAHGWGGVELLQALSAGRLLGFLDLLNRQDSWPFGFSLLLLPPLAAGGGSVAAATVLSAVLFALLPALLLGAAREVEPGPTGIAAGLLAAALAATSPLYRLFAVLVMRETAGACLALAAFALYLRARRRGTPAAWRLAGLAGLALFLVKYNYGLIWGACAALHAFLELPPARRRELLAAAGRRLSPWASRRPGHVALALYLDLLLLALLARVNPGYWVYAGLLVGTAVAAVRLARDRAGVLRRWRALGIVPRALLATVVLPLWIWALSPYPIHPKSLFAFLSNRSSGPPWWEPGFWLFYPRVLRDDYAATPLLGVAVLLLGAGSLWRLRSQGSAPRLLAWTGVAGLAMATLHPFKEPRFLATVVPFLFLMAGRGAARAAAAAGRRLPAASGSLAVILALTAPCAVLAPAALAGDLDARLAAGYRLHSADPAYRNALDFLARHLPPEPGGRPRPSVEPPRIALLGTFNELSPSLVRWHLALAPPEHT